LYLLIATLTTTVAHGQNPVVVGESLSFRSAVLGEDRQLFISKPAEYDGAQNDIQSFTSWTGKHTSATPAVLSSSLRPPIPLELFEKGGIQAVHTHFREGGERCGYVRTTSPFMVSMIVAELIWKGRLDEASRLLVTMRRPTRRRGTNSTRWQGPTVIEAIKSGRFTSTKSH